MAIDEKATNLQRKNPQRKYMLYTNMSMRRYAPIIVLQLCILSGEPAAAKVPALLVLGDSTVDTGNNNYISTVVRSDFAPYGRDLRLGNGQPTGRFSNGRLTVDFISEAFGLPPLVPPYLDPSANMSSLASGACFASAGAGYDNATSDLMEYAAKLRSFQGEDKARETLTEALYLVSMGTNDFLENYYAVPHGNAAKYPTASAYGGYVLSVAESFVRALHALGARKIDLNGMPPMGCLPMERALGGACTEEYNAVAEDYNAGLRAVIDRLNGELGGARIVYGDVYGPVSDALAHPTSYGLENVEAGCCGATGRFEMGYLCNARNPLTCADAGKFAFWDAIHPTERLHRALADAKMNTTLHVFL
ncbi:hypothetical protein VPH35_116607 [Triticum aestivum]